MSGVARRAREDPVGERRRRHLEALRRTRRLAPCGASGRPGRPPGTPHDERGRQRRRRAHRPVSYGMLPLPREAARRRAASRAATSPGTPAAAGRSSPPGSARRRSPTRGCAAKCSSRARPREREQLGLDLRRRFQRETVRRDERRPADRLAGEPLLDQDVLLVPVHLHRQRQRDAAAIDEVELVGRPRRGWNSIGAGSAELHAACRSASTGRRPRSCGDSGLQQVRARVSPMARLAVSATSGDGPAVQRLAAVGTGRGTTRPPPARGGRAVRSGAAAPRAARAAGRGGHEAAGASREEPRGQRELEPSASELGAASGARCVARRRAEGHGASPPARTRSMHRAIRNITIVHSLPSSGVHGFSRIDGARVLGGRAVLTATQAVLMPIGRSCCQAQIGGARPPQSHDLPACQARALTDWQACGLRRADLTAGWRLWHDAFGVHTPQLMRSASPA